MTPDLRLRKFLRGLDDSLPVIRALPTHDALQWLLLQVLRQIDPAAREGAIAVALADLDSESAHD